jgi:hypothetical protein
MPLNAVILGLARLVNSPSFIPVRLTERVRNMGDGMDKVKALLAAGATLSQAVRSALGARSLRAVALERALAVSDLSSALAGSRLATDRVVAAMVAELGGTTDEWRLLFGEAMQQRAAASAVGQ